VRPLTYPVIFLFLSRLHDAALLRARDSRALNVHSTSSLYLPLRELLESRDHALVVHACVRDASEGSRVALDEFSRGRSSIKTEGWPFSIRSGSRGKGREGRGTDVLKKIKASFYFPCPPLRHSPLLQEGKVDARGDSARKLPVLSADR